MSAFFWFENVPTVMSQGGVTTYLLCRDEHFPQDAPSQEWVKRGQDKGEPVTIPTRAAVAEMLKGVDAKAITDAGLKAETLDVDAPKTGSAEAKERAQQEKLSAVLPVAEFEKLEKLRASVVKEEVPVEEKLADVLPVETKVDP